MPPVADQVTAVFAEPATVAVNAWCPPWGSVELAGDTVTMTDVRPRHDVNLGRIACAPAVLTGRTMSPGVLLTSMIPWFAAGSRSRIEPGGVERDVQGLRADGEAEEP